MAAPIERLHALYDAGHLSEFWAYLNRLLERDDAETGTADDRITAEQIAVMRKYLDNMEKRHLREAAKELASVSVNDLLGRVFPVDVSAMVDEPMFQGWLEVRRRLEQLSAMQIEVAAFLGALERAGAPDIEWLVRSNGVLRDRLKECETALAALKGR